MRSKTDGSSNSSSGRYLYPQIAKEWDYTKNIDLTPDKVIAHSSKKVWWKCSKCGYEWIAEIHNRTNGHGCPVCAGSVVPGVNDLFTLHPELIAEWPSRNNDINASKISIKSRKVAWWICPNGHEWQETVNHKLKNIKCPICSHTQEEQEGLSESLFHLTS